MAGVYPDYTPPSPFTPKPDSIQNAARLQTSVQSSIHAPLLSPSDLEFKPSMRGVLHQYGCLVSIIAGSILIATCPPSPPIPGATWLFSTGRGILGSSVFALSLSLLLGVSATYHRNDWTPGARHRMERLDHSAIYVLIAGTYTPLCFLALNQEHGRQLLATIWTAAIAGVTKTLLWTNAPRGMSSLLYILMGWVAVLYVNEFREGIGMFGGVLMVVGGVLYSFGAVMYALRRPNPFPWSFGHHEVFHLFVLAAAACHFIEVARLVHGYR